MRFTTDMLEELNTLLRFDLATSQLGIKIHKSAAPEVIAATKRLHEKGLITQSDGGYLTQLGRETAEHAQILFTILVTRPNGTALDASGQVMLN